MAGLLNTLKKNWRGLLDEVQAAPESLRALTQPAAAQQFDAALRKGGTIDKEKAVQMAMDVLQTTPMGVMGKIVYHGSPHKFDKFDMSKIGTGEGAQAYGHGLYMAETPEVANEYAKNLSTGGKFLKVGDREIKPLAASTKWTNEETAAANLIDAGGDFDRAIRRISNQYEKPTPLINEIERLRKLGATLSDPGNLYKVDIPDEAVSRMLDWDKPLSQQSEYVKSLIPDAGSLVAKTGSLPNPVRRAIERVQDGTALGSDFVNRLSYPNGNGAFDPANASMMLKKLGIPGIRYLDGGSRTAGEGTSNFVLFDDQLPRILERNGIPTGLNPWAPGEWRGLLEP